MRDRLIAHRGLPLEYPENSLAGYRAAIDAGALLIETDVQLSADRVALLHHDAGTHRITGRAHTVSSSDSRLIQSLPAGYPERFGDTFNANRVDRLSALAELLSGRPEVSAFIEIKPEATSAFGVTAAVDCVLATLAPVAARCVLISVDDAALVYSRTRSSLPIGWVLPDWSESRRRQLIDLAPDYVFGDHSRLPTGGDSLWPGPWRWVLYTANDAETVHQLFALGADLVETDDITGLL